MGYVLVCGAGGFIGGHLVKRLKREGFWVRGVDLKFHEFSESEADDFVIGDLRDQNTCRAIIDRSFDEVYQLAADMGGAGYMFTGEHDADLMHNSATINLNILDLCHKRDIRKIFYSSSACMYPSYNQDDPLNPNCSEDSTYPAAPDSEYGWEKLFSERLYLAYRRNFGRQTHVGDCFEMSVEPIDDAAVVVCNDGIYPAGTYEILGFAPLSGFRGAIAVRAVGIPVRRLRLA
jgi:GDP-D-mannose 3', 5'-epimerase